MNAEPRDPHRVTGNVDEESSPKGVGTVWNQVHDAAYIAQLLQARDIYGNIYFGDIEHLEPARYPKEYQDYLSSVYVADDYLGFERLRKGVLRNSYGYIVGNPGSGREIAAVALLSSGGYSARYLLLEAGELGQLRRMPQEKRSGYIIDLSNYEHPFERAQRELWDFWFRAKLRDSVVLVILRPGQRAKEGFESPPFLIGPSPGLSVFTSHLEHLTGESAQPWADREDVCEVLGVASPEQAVRLARISVDLHAQYGTDVGNWISRTLAAHGKWGRELEEWFDHHDGAEGVWPRIVLMACAILEGTDAEVVLASADRLAERLGQAPGDAGGLLGLGVASTLRSVGATHCADGSVRFDDYQYSDAVLDYLWVQHPRMREKLLGWATELCSRRDFGQSEALAVTWALLIIRQREDEWVNRIFNLWVKSPGTLDAAVAFGAHLAAVPTFGQRMRSRLYAIATNPASPVHARAVALVCERFGKINLASALVRLRRLSETENSSVRKWIISTLVILSDERTLWRPLVEEVVAWASDGSEFRWHVAVSFVVQELSEGEDSIPRLLAHAVSAADEEKVDMTVALMWNCLLDRSDDGLVVQAAEKWIPLAIEGTTQGRVFVELLKSAVRGRRKSTPAEITLRTVTANRALSRWCATHQEQADKNQESVLALHETIHQAGRNAAPLI